MHNMSVADQVKHLGGTYVWRLYYKGRQLSGIPTLSASAPIAPMDPLVGRELEILHNCGDFYLYAVPAMFTACLLWGIVILNVHCLKAQI